METLLSSAVVPGGSAQCAELWHPLWICSPGMRTGGSGMWGEAVFDLLQNQSLEALHQYRCEGNRTVVIVAG